MQGLAVDMHIIVDRVVNLCFRLCGSPESVAKRVVMGEVEVDRYGVAAIHRKLVYLFWHALIVPHYYYFGYDLRIASLGVAGHEIHDVAVVAVTSISYQ